MAVNELILLRRFALNGDADAFAEIVKQHAPLVYGVCLRIIGNKDTAADAVQDTFLQLVHDAANITCSLPNWLHRTATNRAIDLIRQDSQRKKRELTYAARPKTINAEDAKAAWHEISVCIDEELENLDDKTKEVIIMRFFENLTTNEIAEKCGISQITVYRWMESGIELLRLKLKSRNVIVPAAILAALLTENRVQAAPASIMKELGKIAIAGSKASIGAKIASSISAGIAVKTKIMVGILIVLLGAGLTVVFSFIANGDNKSSSTWELVRSSLRNDSSSETNTNKDIPSDINQLLSKFSQAREKTKSFIIDSNSKTKFEYVDNKRSISFSGTMYFKSSLKYDGNRKRTTSYVWGNINPQQPNVLESEADYSSGLWDGKNKYSYTRSGSRDDLGYLIFTKIKDGEINTAVLDENRFSGQYKGYARGDDKSIVELIKENPSQVKLSEKPENIRGVDCFAIDGVFKGYGQYHVWIDPVHDYHIVKMEVNRSENDVAFGNKLDEGNFDKETYEVLSFERYGDIWFPKQYKTFSDTNTYGNPRSDERTFTIRKALFNPDHEAINSFKPDDIPNGAKVDVPGVDGISFAWKDGKIVDSEGHEIDPYNLKKVSLIGKPMPVLRKFLLVNIDSKFIENKRILICFWDMENKKSIDYIKRLNERTEAFLDRDIYIVFINAKIEPVLDNTLDRWVSENKILPPMGASRYDLNVLGNICGVQSFPWLILTDKNHIVSDEGLSLTELDEKINTIMKR